MIKKTNNTFHTTQEVLNALAKFPAGAVERVEILDNPDNRQKVLSTGTSMVLYAGEIQNAITPCDKLDNVYIGLIERLTAKTGERDGLGNLGGLSERISEDDFSVLSYEEKAKLIGIKDDVIRNKNNQIVLTKSMSVISRNNVIREAGEELGNIGVSLNVLSFDSMVPVPLDGIKDDNYILNRWDGKGISYAISPCCYLVRTHESVLNKIVHVSAENYRQSETEVAHFRKIKLTDALTCYGKPNMDANNKNEKRDMNSDYRYPHEWLSAWYLASVKLNHQEEDLKKLAVQLQQKTPYLIDFEQACQEMKISFTQMASVLGISKENMVELVKTAKEVYLAMQLTQKKYHTR